MDSRFYRDEYNILKNTNIKFSDNFAKSCLRRSNGNILKHAVSLFYGI